MENASVPQIWCISTNAVISTHSESDFIFAIQDQATRLALGVLVIIINTHSWFVFFLNVFKMSSINNWDINLKQDNVEFESYFANSEANV